MYKKICSYNGLFNHFVGHFGFINFNKSFFFELIALKPGIYRVTASAQGYLSACTVFLFNRPKCFLATLKAYACAKYEVDLQIKGNY